MSASRSRISHRSIVAAIVVALVAFYFLRDVLLPFIFAGAAAYIINPWISAVERRFHFPRWVVASVFYLLLLGCIGTVIWVLGDKAYTTASQISIDAPQRLHGFLVNIFSGEEVHVFGARITASDLTNKAMAEVQRFLSSFEAAKWAAIGVGSIIGIIFSLVLVFYFFLLGPQLAAGLITLIPPEHRPEFREYASRINPFFRRYIIGLVVVTLVTSSIAWVGVGPVFHLPYPILLSVATGVLELLPVVGPIASAALLGGVAVLHGGSAWTLLGFGAFCLALRLLIDQVIGPLVLGKAVRISPVAVIFAFVAGGILFGLAGVILAIPATTAIKLALDQYYSIPIREK